MSLNDQLAALRAASRGSYAGVPFAVEAMDASGGRRLQVLELPLSDLHAIEDLGRKARTFSIECVTHRSLRNDGDAGAARDALVAALERGGAATLVHPALGTRQVEVRDYRLREHTREAGVARFSITFIDAATASAEPAADTDARAEVGRKADAAQGALAAAFARAYSVFGLADHLVDEITADLARALDMVERTVAGITGPIAALIRTPASMAGQVLGSLATLRAQVAEPRRALALYESLFTLGAAQGMSTATPTRRRQAQALHAQRALLGQAALVEAARLAVTTDYATKNDALAVRDRLLGGFDAQMQAVDPSGAAMDDALYGALADLRAAVAADLRTRGARLPELITWTPPATMPALLIAWRLYGDPHRAEEIVARNQIKHPGAVPGGMPLEVLSA